MGQAFQILSDRGVGVLSIDLGEFGKTAVAEFVNLRPQSDIEQVVV